MKKSLAIVSLFICVSANCQEAGIYSLRFNVDEVLMNELSAETTSDRTVARGISMRSEVPQELLDSAVVATENLISQKFSTDAKLLYFENANGRRSETMIDETFYGMPYVTKNKAVKSNLKNLYVRIEATAVPQGKVTVQIGEKKVKKERPKVTMHVWVYDSNGAEVFKNSSVLRDFDQIRSKSRVIGTINWKISEVLTSTEIVQMYVLSLEQTLFGE